MRKTSCENCSSSNATKDVRCTKCAPAQPSFARSLPTQRASRRSLTWGIVILLGIAGIGSVSHHSDATESNIFVAPTAKPDAHATRAKVQHYWNSTVEQLAVANATLQLAAESMQNGDSAAASTLVQRGSEYANQALQYAGSEQPTGWGSVGDGLTVAANEYRKSLDDVHSWIDSQKPSDMAKADEESQSARDALASAQGKAGARIREMGGDPSNLVTPDQAARAMASVISTLRP